MHIATTTLLGVLALVLGSNAAAASPKCHADNCARAVVSQKRPRTSFTHLLGRPWANVAVQTGTAFGTALASAHKADCSSFLQCTSYSTPPPVTTTITASEPVITAVMLLEPRDTASVVCPSSVPSYASACSGTARYSSACSCVGVTKTTTTVVVAPSTVTATAIPTCPAAASDQCYSNYPAGGNCYCAVDVDTSPVCVTVDTQYCLAGDTQCTQDSDCGNAKCVYTDDFSYCGSITWCITTTYCSTISTSAERVKRLLEKAF